MKLARQLGAPSESKCAGAGLIWGPNSAAGKGRSGRVTRF